MKYLSICSGIEAASVAWHPLGWTPWAFAEIEPFPAAVLKHHYPHVPNLGETAHRDGGGGPVILAIDVLIRLRAAIVLESAAIAPQTSELIEAAKEAAAEIERLRTALHYHVSELQEARRQAIRAADEIERLRQSAQQNFSQ